MKFEQLKKVVLVTMERNAKSLYAENLRGFFHEYIEVEAYSVHDELPDFMEADLVVVSNEYVNKHIHFRLDESTEIVYLRRTFTYENLKAVFELPHGMRVMLVDYSMETCMNMLSVLKGVGIRHLELIPVYKGIESEEIEKLIEGGVDTAITPGLSVYVPEQIKRVIDIGWTMIDMSTMLEIAMKLHIYDAEIEEKLLIYSLHTLPLNNSVLMTLKNNMEIKNTHEAVLDVMEDGVLIINQENRLIHWNKSLLELLHLREAVLKDRTIENSGIQKEIKRKIMEEETFERALIALNDDEKNIIITKKRIDFYSDSKGYLIILKDMSSVQEESAAIRLRIKEQGYAAKYTFDRIVARHEKMMNCIDKAKRMSCADAAVLITGESGTGKEVFAQSIHNHSHRRDMPFVAINCAALPEALLESELFGYEAGAFTDAKKTGKKGLFEMAHKGTIFLDEIGDMPRPLQVKLLRVLQEREVMRIGGHSIIPVDVRVIAATNQDLEELVEKKVFREDLYYRLNVIPLHLPPLRERKSDIPLLIDEVFRELQYRENEIDGELMRRLLRYSWKGNVRELKNCIQYMVYMSDGERLTINDAPDYIHRVDITEEGLVHDSDAGQDHIQQRILQLLEERSMGRRELHRRLNEEGKNISEYGIRKIMDELKQEGYIAYKGGRGGAYIKNKK